MEGKRVVYVKPVDYMEEEKIEVGWEEGKPYICVETTSKGGRWEVNCLEFSCTEEIDELIDALNWLKEGLGGED